MSFQEPLVYVLLVNWNTARHTIACLDSLQHVSYPNYRVLVIDNASRDDSVDAIAQAYPDVPIVRNGRNMGFTGANNVGFEHALRAGADFVYLLNTDTWVAADFLSEAVETAISESDNSIGIVGSKVLHADRPDCIQFMGAYVNLATGYSGRPFGYDQIDQGQYDSVTDVDRVTGCAMMISRACLEATDGFDDAFFAFHEDVDLCLCARSASFRVVMSPQSRIWHEGGGSTGGVVSSTHMYYDVRNTFRLLDKHNPTGDVITSLLRTACIVGAHAIQAALSHSSDRSASAILTAVADHYCGITRASYKAR